MNPRQRRGALLLIISALGALGVIGLVANYVAEVRGQVGPSETVLALAADVEALSPLTEEMLTEVTMPVRWAPDTAIVDRASVVGLVAAADLTQGSILQRGMLADPPHLEAGEREIAILVDAETGVAGKIGQGSLVDIYATFPEIGHADGSVAPARSEIVVSGARIIDVGLPGPAQDDGDAFGGTNVVPVTFSLSIIDSLVLTYVESFATKVRLGLRGEGDDREVPEGQRRFNPPQGRASGRIRPRPSRDAKRNQRDQRQTT